MTHDGPDSAPRKGASEAKAIEGLLAYAFHRPRSSNKALDCVDEAVVRSRALARESPGDHVELLVRCLRAKVRLLVRRGRAVEALRPAEEAVDLCRAKGGDPLVAALTSLAAVLEALHHYSEAAAALAEADAAIAPPDDCPGP